MRSTFFGLETARRGLFSSQRALDTTGHNISNANTPGYSRQVVRLTETTPFSPASFTRPKMAGMIGTGVEVSSIERMRDEFLDRQIRNESQTFGRWEVRRSLLSEIELIFAEPSDTGIRSTLDAFWSSLQDLAVDPEQGPTRSVVLQKAAALSDSIRHTYDQLAKLQESINKSVPEKVKQVNSAAVQIARLNDQISLALTAGLQPNDLMDQRDLLIKDLSKIADVKITDGKLGDVMLTIAGTPLVDGKYSHLLEAVPDPLNSNYYEVEWAATGSAVQINNGELKGLLETRDSIVAQYKQQLDTLAAEIIDRVNQQHQAGFDLTGAPGGLFFAGAGAADMAVDPLIAANATRIAAASNSALESLGTGDGATVGFAANLGFIPVRPGSVTVTDGGVSVTDDGLGNFAGAITGTIDYATGAINVTFGAAPAAGAPITASYVTNAARPADGRNATLLAGLKKQALMPGSMSFDDYFAATISQLGIDGEEAETQTTNEERLLGHLENQQQAVSGVSLDEEMVNMVRYQHGYNAAARVITVMDEVLDLIINRMGAR